MKKLLLTSILLAIASVGFVFGQNNWNPGYVITQKGDTLRGTIYYKESGCNAFQCKFKKDPNAEIEIFSPSQLIGYRFEEGKFFVSKNIKELNPDTPVFVEFLINGKVSLYRYNDKDVRFFAEKDAVILELKNTEKLIFVDNADKLVTKKEYIGILNILFKDANMSSKIAASSLQPKSIIKLAKTYHETVCTNEKCIVYERNIKTLHVDFGLIGGISYNKFDFDGVLNTDYSPGYMIGCRIDFLNFIDMIERLYFTVDVNLQKYNTYNLNASGNGGNGTVIKYNGVYNYFGNWYSYYQNNMPLKVDLDVLALQIPISVNYKFSTRRVQPYIGAGLLGTYVLSQNSAVKVSDSGQLIPTYQFGFQGKIGCNYVLKNQSSIFVESGIDSAKDAVERKVVLLMTNTSFVFKCGYTF